MELQAPTEASMVKGATAHLAEVFPSVETSRIESAVRRSVHEWLKRARIKLFVGIIAERYARTELQQAQPWSPSRRPKRGLH
jgi:hypothetical protein